VWAGIVRDFNKSFIDDVLIFKRMCSYKNNIDVTWKYSPRKLVCTGRVIAGSGGIKAAPATVTYLNPVLAQ